MRERENKVRELSKTFNFPGYDYSPLEEAKVIDLVDKLQEIVRKAESDLKRLQVSSSPVFPADSQTEGSRKEREMQAELDQLSNAKTTAIATKQSKQDQIVSATSDLGLHADTTQHPNPSDGDELRLAQLC